ncbi:hypothetical protein CIPAW_04G015800 [Carya illinoinensis]|uniref:Uncharacterized protein n=1 Tax=Carya illinoinensis TaxID=32201 RepID=A0A8T1QQ36_CARIL|nr:hypothetical protein CIPAW_04G015800 [Carya illinoinensis]
MMIISRMTVLMGIVTNIAAYLAAGCGFPSHCRFYR